MAAMANERMRCMGPVVVMRNVEWRCSRARCDTAVTTGYTRTRIAAMQRAFDVLRLIDWLKSLGRTEIHLVALGFVKDRAALCRWMDGN